MGTGMKTTDLGKELSIMFTAGRKMDQVLIWPILAAQQTMDLLELFRGNMNTIRKILLIRP